MNNIITTQTDTSAIIATTQRIAYWDVAKCVAIFCVVWGHYILNMTSNSTYWLDDSLSKFIYSFHVPLFMLISGYFAYKSFSKPFLPTIHHKFKQLIFPTISWALVFYVLSIIVHNQYHFSLSSIHDIARIATTSLWFLKSLFLCYLITLSGAVIYQKYKWFLILYVLIIIAFGRLLNFAHTISMLPFFLAGIALHHYENFLSKSTIIISTICCWAISILILCTWESTDYLIYFNRFEHNISGYQSITLRTVLGLSTSIAVLMTIRLCTTKFHHHTSIATLSSLGTMTLGIYCVQEIFAANACGINFTTHFDYIGPTRPTLTQHIIYDLIITLGATILTIIISVLIIKYLRRNRITRRFFLGER